MKVSKSHRFVSWVVFTFYIALLVYFMFFAEALGRTEMVSGYRYNLVPLKEMKRFLVNFDKLGMWPVMLNICGNVIAFIPFGYFLPFLSIHRLKLLRVFLLTFGLSLGIEIVQLLSKVGSFDIDDIILNTLGGVLGYILFLIAKAINKNNK